MYDISSGTIEIDGIKLDQYTKKSLRSQIAIVPQSLSLFHRSIFDNVCYGCGDVSKDEVIEASKRAYCVLEEGKIVEEGSHEELLSQKGIYSRFWSHQSDGFIKTQE